MYTEQEVKELIDLNEYIHQKETVTAGNEALDSAAQLVDSCLDCDPTLIKLAQAIRDLKSE